MMIAACTPSAVYQGVAELESCMVNNDRSKHMLILGACFVYCCCADLALGHLVVMLVWSFIWLKIPRAAFCELFQKLVRAAALYQ